MKTLIIICLYILGAILYAAWCIGDNKNIGNEILELGDRWKNEVGSSPAICYTIVIALFMVVSMLWPVWIIYGIRKSL